MRSLFALEADNPSLFNRAVGDGAHGDDLRENHAPLVICILHVLEIQLPPTVLPNDHLVHNSTFNSSPSPPRLVCIPSALDKHLAEGDLTLAFHHLYEATWGTKNCDEEVARVESAGLENIRDDPWTWKKERDICNRVL